MASFQQSPAFFVAALCLAVSATPAQSFPTMFVEGDKAYTWEGRLKLVPYLKQDEGISVDTINAFIRDKLSRRAVSSPLTSFSPICLMNFAHPEDVVSSDRATQAQIKADLDEYPRTFAESYETGAETFLLRIGIFEDCKNKEAKNASSTAFMALVITDQKGVVREFDALDWQFIRLFKRDDGKINVLGCFSCGEVREIGYNPLDKEFYYKWIGH